MKFFIPHAESTEQAEIVLESICTFIGAKVPKKRIYRLYYKHNGMNLTATVGEPIDKYYKESNSEVIAIIPMSENLFAVCLPERGVVRGDPVLAGADYSTHVEYFE